MNVDMYRASIPVCSKLCYWQFMNIPRVKAHVIDWQERKITPDGVMGHEKAWGMRLAVACVFCSVVDWVSVSKLSGWEIRSTYQ